MVKVSPSVIVEVEIDSVVYKLSRPKIGAAAAFEKKLENAKREGSQSTSLFIELIESCGLPLEVINQLDSDQLLEVYSAIVAPKKSG